MTKNNLSLQSDIILYTSLDGQVKVNVLFGKDTVWLSQDQIAELFDKGRSTIAEHIQNVFNEGELEENSVCRDFRRTGIDRNRVSAKEAWEKAKTEFMEYKKREDKKYISDFDRQVKKYLKQRVN